MFGKPDISVSVNLNKNESTWYPILASFNASNKYNPKSIQRMVNWMDHTIYRILYPFFDRTFIADSYSCRNEKGTHRAIDRFQAMFRQVSRNNTQTCWVLKLDIKKFFASIDHDILKQILAKYIPDQDIMWLLEEIIMSFRTPFRNPDDWILNQVQDDRPRGLPLGNLTSQLFVNVYLNEFDQFVKHKLKASYYIRYADDFVVLSHDHGELINQLTTIQGFLKDKLKLTLHPGKVILKTFASGLDFLGWMNFPTHKVLRTATKHRMLRRIKLDLKPQAIQSYLGLLKHGDTYELQKKFLNI